MTRFDRAADPDGFSRAAADAVGVGRREALGVRQLAAALFLCSNNVSVPIWISSQRRSKLRNGEVPGLGGHQRWRAWLTRGGNPLICNEFVTWTTRSCHRTSQSLCASHETGIGAVRLSRNQEIVARQRRLLQACRSATPRDPGRVSRHGWR
ncbi:MAG: hypothetical protein GX456_04325 [Verrucomicrobia bacterium]|nr:hypothetical protein [Verrucomicrobiota bacterium]